MFQESFRRVSGVAHSSFLCGMLGAFAVRTNTSHHGEFLMLYGRGCLQGITMNGPRSSVP